MNNKEKQLEKARRHNANMKRYFERHPEQKLKNQIRSREYQRRKRAEEKAKSENKGE